MKHPIIQQKALIYYSMIWAVIIIAHFLILYRVYGFSTIISLSDSLIFNLTFALFALGIWYVVQFSPTRDILTLIGAHLLAAFIIVMVWYNTGVYLLSTYFSQEAGFSTFLQEVKPLRILQGAIYYVIIILIYYLNRDRQSLKENLNREHELEKMLKEAELNMLKWQINPHFIFNSLNSISSLAISDPQKSQDMIIKLSEFLRSSLGKDNKDLISLKEELKSLGNYLDIEKVRFGEQLIIENNINEECLVAKVPNMILQPLIENAIKFGIYESLDPVSIKLDSELKKDHLKVSIQNTFDPESAPVKGKGIGLSNVRSRLALIYGSYELMHYFMDRNIFTVELKIPQLHSTDEKD